MSLLDRLLLLLTGLIAIYLTWRFYTRYRQVSLGGIFWLLPMFLPWPR